MSVALKRMSVQEYLSQERKAMQKSEYFEGEIFAMAGCSTKKLFHEEKELTVSITLPSLGISLELAELYRHVQFDDPQTPIRQANQ